MNEQERLKALVMLSNDIAEVKDLDILMERILKSAREFVNCDAGSIYIKENDTLHFTYAQNETLSSRLKPDEKLIYTTFSMPITHDSIAGYVASTGETLSIEDMYQLPDSLPYHFDKSYDESTNYKTHSTLTIPLKTVRFKIIGVLQLINATDDDGNVVRFEKDIEPYIAYFANNAAGALERAQLMRTILLRMIQMAELRDPKETGNHVNRVGGYSVEIYEAWAKKRNIPQAEIDKSRDILRMAAMLHDVGKIAIPDKILKKPGRLSDDEYEVMKQHTIIGSRLFENLTSEIDEAARDVALNHHEKFNGKGYPGYVDTETGEPIAGHVDSDGKPLTKKGEEIPIFGRIVALADVYDALSSARAYKEAWTEERVLSIIKEESGQHFDPELIDAFMVCLPSIKSMTQRYS